MKINLLKCGKSILTFVLAFSVLAVSLFTGAFAVSADTVVFISDSDLADNGAEDVAAYGAVPSMYQYEYNKQEIGAFLHFSMSTMTDQEIATGDETPSDFTLDEKIDADGYVKAMKDAGFGRIIITTKHHDGFCIWDTEWTEHDIASTNYPGDVLEDLSIACTKYDMDMGIYMSPWDQNSKYYGYYDAEGNSCGWKDDVLNYNDYFVGQLTEILGNDKYGNDGRFVEIWLDPAKNGGEEQWYDYERWIATIRELEGTAAGAEEDPLIFGVGSYDTTVHWIGNERGIANSETWSKLKKDASGTTNGGTANYKGTSTVVGEKYGNLWTVMEADTSIIPGGWFWSEAKKIPKELDDLRDLYCDSVGHGAALLLNIPLNSDGKLDEAISDRTNEWAENIQKSFFDNNLAAAEGVTIYASDVQGDDVRFKPSNVVDGKDDTYWTATQGTKNSSLLIDFGKEVTFDAVVIEEEIYHGQRVEAFTVEYKTPDGIWLEYSSGVTIGSKRVILDRPVTATQVRIDFQGLTDGEQVATPVISHVGIHKATEAFERDGVVWDGSSDTNFAVVDENAEAGTKTNPYIITSPAELYGMVASGGNGKYYKVADGIDKFVLNPVDGMSKEEVIEFFVNASSANQAVTLPPNKWYYYSTWPEAPNDYYKQPFTGHFDGNGATIVGLYGKGDWQAHLGFIPYVENADVTVENVKFQNAYIYSEDTRPEWGSAVVIGNYSTNSATKIKINNVSVVNSTIRDYNAAAIMGYSYITTNVAPRCEISNIVTANNTITCNANSADRHGVVFGFYSFWNGNTVTKLSNMILADNVQFASNAEALGKTSTYTGVSFQNIYTIGAKPSENYAYTGVTFGVNADNLKGNAAKTTASALNWGSDFVAVENSVPDLALFHNMKSVADGEQGHSYKCADEGCAVIATDTVAHNYVNGSCEDCGYTHEHDFTTVPETPATCTEDGVKAYRVCSIDICEGLKYDIEEDVVVTDADLKITADATIIENHSFGDNQTIVSNCEEKANITYKECGECGIFLIGDELVDELPAAPDHEYGEDGVCDCGDREVVADGWVENADRTWSYYKDGALVTGWLNLGTWYYLDANGVMCTGWKQVSGTWYYFASSGAMQTGWVNDRGTWYYCDANGAMQTGWKQVSGTWYYFASSGAMRTGWQQIGGTWYYFASSGAMCTGWKQVSGTWYYFASSGAMVTGWKQVSGTWYYFASSGAMQTGWQQIGGKWYYFASSGAMHTGWLNLGGTWYYMYSSGAMATNIYISGGYINASGVWR